MKIFPFQAIYPQFKLVASTDSFIKSVKHQFLKYKETGFFEKSSKEALFIHEIIKNKRTYRGIIASASLEDYIDESVLIHEKTLASKRQITMELIINREAIIKPILVAYDQSKDIDAIVKKVVDGSEPMYSTLFEEDKIRHNFYQIDEPKLIEKICLQFEKVKTSFLADGHHRRAVVIDLFKNGQLGKKNLKRKSLLTAFFPFSDLDIHDFNRIVDVFDIISPVRFIIELTKYFKVKNIKGPKKPNKKFVITAYLNGEWLELKWKKSILNKFKDQDVLLDAQLLNTFIFEELLNIEDVRQTQRIKYIEGVKELSQVMNIVNADFKKIAFFVSAVDKEELKQVARDKKSMPPKSTWFEPRLKNGLIVEEW